MNKEICNSIIYNVYPTSFYDSNGDGIGDLQGIIEKLDYIKQFADIVWVNPVFKSPFRDGGYDVADYFAIDEKFGTMEDVKRLTDKAHALGLKVLFDLVVGHTSDQHPWFIQSQKYEKNEYSDRYIWMDDVFGWCPYKHITGFSERDGNYLVNFFSFQPSLNFGFAEKKFDWQHHYTDEVCQKVHEEVIRIIRHYMALGVDGFRVDLANSIVKDDEGGKCSCEVWRKIFGRVREEYPNAIFVSEWGQPRYAVKNGDFDIDFLTHCFDEGYNNLFRKEPDTNVVKSEGHSFFRQDGLGEAKTFFDYFLSNMEEIEGKGYISVVTGNHDLPRIAIGRSQEDLKAVFAFILALPCVPLIYYGDEIGMPYTKLRSKDGGYCRTGSRTPMQWTAGKNAGFSTTDGELYLPVNDNYPEVNVASRQQDADSLVNEVAKLVAVKRENPDLFGCGNGFELVSDTYPLVFKRTDGKRTLLCAVNPSEREYTLDTPHKAVLASANATVEADKVTLAPVSYVWLEI
ncbi:MAG: glycosylase [Clostridia bacterium]|nr:glycosylase [Clostridia bacterium]